MVTLEVDSDQHNMKVLKVAESLLEQLSLEKEEIAAEKNKTLNETEEKCNNMIDETKKSIELEKSAAEEYLANFENQKKIIEKTQTFGANIKLNVGGSKFTTTKATLTRFPDTALGAMFSGRFEMNLDEEGYVFIDRDGTHFRHILNFLRDPASFEWIKMNP